MTIKHGDHFEFRLEQRDTRAVRERSGVEPSSFIWILFMSGAALAGVMLAAVRTSKRSLTSDSKGDSCAACASYSSSLRFPAS